jgi:nucleoside-triphosphatase THEP1
MNENNVLKNLITLIKIFNDVPELFAKKLLEHNVFNEEFINILSNNIDLINAFNNNVKTKKVFYSIDDVNKYYDKFFKVNFYKQNEIDKYNVYNGKNEKEVLIIQLENALRNEDYILADKINAYMKLLNINYIPNIK